MPPTGQFIILTPGFAQDEQDTTCIPFLQTFVLSVRKLYPSLQLTVLAFQYPFEKKQYQWHGIEVVALGGANRNKLHRLLTWHRAWRQLKRLNRQANIAGIFSVWVSECGLVGKRFSQANRLKHYMWLAGQDARETNHFVKRIKPDGRKIIAFSEFVQEQFSRNFGIVPFCVANNGINPDVFPELNAKTRKYDVLGAGSLIKLKNYSLFVEMMNRLRPQYPPLSAAIAGEGPERPALEAQIARLGLRNNLRLLGSVPHPQVLEMMNNSRVFLHPSSYESNASVLIEALYAGCRVVSFQGLARAPVENLTVCENEQQMMATLEPLLMQSTWPVKRVLFNSMDETARKIVSLYFDP